MATIRFSTAPKLFLTYNTSFDPQEVKNTILNIPRVGASTATGAALDMFTEQLSGPSSGHRPDAELVTILVTDGQTLEDYATDFLPAVDRFHQTGVKSYAFGIGRRININELSLIASSPADSHVYLVDSISIMALQRFVQQTVLDVMCSATGPTTTAPTTQPATTQAATTGTVYTSAPDTTAAATTGAATTAAATTAAGTTAAATTAAGTTAAQTRPASSTTAASTTARPTTQADTTTQAATTQGPSTTQLPCRQRTLDLVLVLDSSASVCDGWPSVLQFAQNIISSSNLAQSGTQ